jgi:hypothetical protein
MLGDGVFFAAVKCRRDPSGPGAADHPMSRIKLNYLFLLFGSMGVIGLIVPIYTDEVAWRMIYGRLFRTGTISGLVPYCENIFSYPVPWIWWPIRIFDSLVAEITTNPIFLRLFAVIGIVALFWVCKKILELLPNLESLGSKYDVFLLFGFGTLFLQFFFFHVEIPIAISFLLAVYFLILPPERRAHFKVWQNAAIILFPPYVAWSFHPIGFFLLPVFLLLAWQYTGSYKKKLIALIAMIAMATPAWTFNTERVLCGRKFVATTYVMTESTEGLENYIYSFYINLANSVDLLDDIRFLYKSEFQMLDARGPVDTVAVQFFNDSLMSMALGFFILAIFGNLFQIIFRRSWFQPRGLLKLVIITSLIGFLGLTTRKPNYYLPFVFPLIFVLVLLFMDDCIWTPLNRKIERGIRWTLHGMVAINFICFSLVFVPQIQPWISGSGLRVGGGSFSAFEFSKQKNNYLNTATECGLKFPMKELITDDLGALSLWDKVDNLVLRYWIQGGFLISADRANISYLEKNNFPYVFLPCETLRGELIPLFRHVNGFCCGSSEIIRDFLVKGTAHVKNKDSR